MNNKKKVLGIFSIAMINIIAVDSLRSLPFSAEYGFSLVFFYLLAALVFFIPTALVSAELATGWPSRGGVYIWVREAFGEKWGFLIIWLQWVYNVVWYPTILSFVAGAFFFLINPQLALSKMIMLATILTLFWGATLINFFGMRVSSLISTLGALIGTLIPMFFIIILGITWIHLHKPLQISFTTKFFWPDLTNFKHLAFLTAVLFGLVGMEMSAVHADEVKNPGKTYPRAILLSSLIILFSLIFASLAIAIVVPVNKLDVVTGLIQAFQIFFHSFHMDWMKTLITIFIIIGGISGVATWIIGPTKGLLVAVNDGNAPKFLAKTNKKGVPTIILFLQAGLFTLLCSVFLLEPSVSSAYWILTAMTAQLALLVYILLFAAALRLRYSKPDINRPYKVPGRKIGIWLVAIIGISACIGTIILGFLPPPQIKTGNLLSYESILILGMLIVSAPPFIIHAIAKSRL